jgi:hypothetical protein
MPKNNDNYFGISGKGARVAYTFGQIVLLTLYLKNLFTIDGKLWKKNRESEVIENRDTCLFSERN